MLRVRNPDRTESGQYVCRLSAHARRHHGGRSQAGGSLLLPELRTVSASAQRMGRLHVGVAGAAVDLPEEAEGLERPEADRRWFHLDRAAFSAVEGEWF